MKNNKGYPFFTVFAVSAAATVLLLPLRIYQYFKVLEPDTGFYDHKDFSVYLMYFLVVFIVVFGIATAFVSRKKFKRVDISLTPVGGAVVYSAAAIGFVIDAVNCVMNFLNVYNSYSSFSGVSMWSYVSKNGGSINMLQGVLAIVTAVYFFALAVGSVLKKDVAPSLKSIALCAPLWAVARLLLRFQTKISFTNVSDLFLELLATVFLMLFLLAFAQTQSRVDKGESYWKMFGYGIPAAVFCLACFIPRAVLIIIGRSDLLCENYAADICDFTNAVLIISTLISRANVSPDNKKA